MPFGQTGLNERSTTPHGILNMIDESALASGIYHNMSKCLALRNKYYELSLQADRDNVKDEQYSVKVNYIKLVCNNDS